MIRKIGMSILMMAISTGVAYAAWSALNPITGNVFATGTLTATITGTPMSVSGAAPGGTPVDQTITINNTGSEGVQVSLQTTAINGTNGVCDYVRLAVSGTYPGGTFGPITDSVSNWATLTPLITSPKLLATEAATITISAHLDANAPNSVQGSNCTWDETFSSN